jgi:predicted  nucleic acid-binding Zn-ribbon protein
MDETIQFLLTLQNYDMRLDELERNLRDIPQNIAGLEEVDNQWNQKTAQEKAQIQNIKLEIQKLEKEIQVIEETIATCKYKLALTRNSKESESLAKKIEDEQRKMVQQEESLLGKMFELDDREAKFSILQQTARDEILRTQDEQKYQRQRITDLEKNRTEVQSKIAVMRKILQENHSDWLWHYDGTKKAIHKMPCVVELKGGNVCGGCHLKLSDYNDQRVDSDFPFIICESCARMIIVAKELCPPDPGPGDGVPW